MSALGKNYQDNDIIIREGETGSCMFIIQEGRVEVCQRKGAREVRVATLGEGDFFGEMAIFEHEVRSATVRAVGQVRALTVDKKSLLKHVAEDPSMALRLLERLSCRIRAADRMLTRIKSCDRRNWDTRTESQQPID